MRVLVVFLALWRAFGPIWTPTWKVPQSHPWRIPGKLVFVGDQEFLVRQTGKEDGPDLVLIHGLGGASLAEWYGIGPLLSDRFRITLVDHRSHGHSPRTIERFDIATLADEVAAVLVQVGITNASVVGYSMGGTIAQELAHRHPLIVDRLILIGTFVSHRGGLKSLRWLGSHIVRAWERFTGVGTPEFRAGYLLATGAVERRHGRWLWQETHSRDVEAGAAATMALLRFDSSEWIKSIDQPTLVIIPLADQLVPVSWQYHLAGELKNARVLELVGARHEAPITHPEPIAEAISQFVGGLAERERDDLPDDRRIIAG